MNAQARSRILFFKLTHYPELWEKGLKNMHYNPKVKMASRGGK
jgi:hypothetical protein